MRVTDTKKETASYKTVNTTSFLIKQEYSCATTKASNPKSRSDYSANNTKTDSGTKCAAVFFIDS